MLQQNEKDAAIEMAKDAANKKNDAVIAIYTYGKGVEIVNKDFCIDRNYYHSDEGRKMFFDPIAKVEATGYVFNLSRD